MISKDYTDILIVDHNGIIKYMDVSNLLAFDYHPDDVIGKSIYTLYENINKDNSTIYKALKEAIPSEDTVQQLFSKRKNVSLVSSTYPIMSNQTVIGAIEFSKVMYSKNTIDYINNHFEHPIYRKNNTRYTIDDIITNDLKMSSIKQLIKKVSQTDSSVLIQGKTGTGKELVAQSIHNLSNRVNKPFISQNCGAIPSNLIESILFGTTKGSFTGSENKSGLLEAANGGTVFLDEINSLPIDLQAKLLTVIEEQRCRRIGSTKYIPINVRFISAMNENPDDLMQSNRLRPDLFFRLSVVQINIPELKNRKDDIELLANYYINFYNNKLNRNIKNIPIVILKYFESYNWPGNIRELRNTIEGIFNLLDDNEDVITPQVIPERIINYMESKTCSSYNNDVRTYNKSPLKTLVTNFEMELINNVLEKNNYNISKSANELGISRQLLKYKLDKK